jgi:hypothetical protein
MKDFPEKILNLPKTHPFIFSDTGLSVIRSSVIFLGFFLIFCLLLAIPEKIWDEHQNTDKYADRLEKSNQRYQSNKAATDPEAQKKWFSERMWAYRKLVYWAHIQKSAVSSPKLEQGLAEWQASKLKTIKNRPPPSDRLLHYLYNPGFFWDIMFLLPISLSVLGLAYHALIKHLDRFSNPPKEGVRPYVPETAAITLLHCLLNRWTAANCFIVALVVTAGNHGSGLVEQLTDESCVAEKVFHWLFPVGFLIVIPFLLLVVRLVRLIWQECTNTTNSPVSFDAGSLIQCKYGLCKAIFWLAAVSSAVALVAVLMTTGGWHEAITNIELTPYKPLQRVIRVFFLGFGLLSVVWVLTLIIARANHKDSINIMANTSASKPAEQSRILDRLVLNEVTVLEYFGVFSIFTILSYGQSALFIWFEADISMQSGIAVLTGLIVLSLVLSILPIMYVWYLIVDSRRYNRWVVLYKDSQSLSESEEEELSELQNKRIIHVIKLIFVRWGFAGPTFSLMLVLLWYFIGIS